MGVAGQEAAKLATEGLCEAAEGGDAAEIAQRIVKDSHQQALATIEQLGRSGQVEAAAILMAVAEGTPGASKDLRKEARRGLHRLRALGLDVPRLAPPAPAPRGARKAELVEAWATISDGVGSRLLWLMAERTLGGVYVVRMILNDVVGIKACGFGDSTRKKAHLGFEAWKREAGLPWVELPSDYAKRLVGEGIELNRESGVPIPREVLLYEQAVEQATLPFERAIICDEISAAEGTLNPELLEESPQILDERELRGWIFGFDEVRGFALDLLQARQSQIILAEAQKVQRERSVVANAIRDTVTPTVQRGLRRRLEESAYVFLRNGRVRQAHLAVAAAQRMDEGALTLHPFLQDLMLRSLELAGEAETANLPADRVRKSPYDPVE